jgi:hypothetical protein
MGMAAAVLGAAVIGGVATTVAAHSASSAASNAAANNNALESQIYQSNKALETPFIASGDTAETTLNGFLGLGDTAASDAAFQKYLGSTGYQFNYNQGLDAVQQLKASQGELNSGATLKAAENWETGLADQYGQQYVGNLQNETATGASAANALAGQGTTYAGQVSANNNSAATAAGNAALATGNAFSGLASSGLSAYALSNGLSSYGAGGGSAFNAFAPLGG